MSAYDVFQRKGPTEPMVHVASLDADDTRMALLLAKECFFRREHPTAIWVVRHDDLHPLPENDVLEPGSDKTYRSIEAYTGIAKKRQAIEERLNHGDTETTDATDTQCRADPRVGPVGVPGPAQAERVGP